MATVKTADILEFCSLFPLGRGQQNSRNGVNCNCRTKFRKGKSVEHLEELHAFGAFHRAVVLQSCCNVPAIMEGYIKGQREGEKQAFWVKSVRACILAETFLLLFLLF